METLQIKSWRRNQSNGLMASTLHCVLLFIYIFALQINFCIAQPVTSSAASGSFCNSDMNCDDKPSNTVCGSNGETYVNLCEMDKAACKAGIEITVLYNGACVTLPPPPEHLCKAHQNRIDTYTFTNYYDYMRTCNATLLRQKADRGTLELEDLVPCYHPQCTDDAYESQQCSINVPQWCWCSTHDGFQIDGTLQYNMPAGFCDERQECQYEGQTYQDGDLFTPPSGCGFCECLDGQVTCFEEYVPNSEGYLNGSQLNLLQEELLFIFYFQYNHEEHVRIDVRHIHQHPTEVSELTKETVLGWKFRYYDRNQDGFLSTPEEYIFQLDLYQFVKCKSFFDHVSYVMDEDKDGMISFDEWNKFFYTDYTDASGRSVQTSGESQPRQRRSIRRKLNKKFYYTLL